MHRKNKGSVLPLTALLIAALVAMGGLAIDMSYAYLNQTKIKNAVDLAALAGVSQLINQSNTQVAKDTALQYLNDNLTMSLPSFLPLTIGNPALSIQIGFYDTINMAFITEQDDDDSNNNNINAIRVSYTYNSSTFLAPIFMAFNVQTSDRATAIKQVAGRMAAGGGFPLALQSSLLPSARQNNNMIDLVQSGTANSFFTAFMDSTASASDINQIIDYFINQTSGASPPSLTVGQSFQINNGALASVYMSLDLTNFVGMTFVSPIVTVDDGFSSMVTVQGFVGYTINDIYMIGNDYHIAATIIPGYIDNRWSGLTIQSGPGSIPPADQPLLANSYGLIQ